MLVDVFEGALLFMFGVDCFLGLATFGGGLFEVGFGGSLVKILEKRPISGE